LPRPDARVKHDNLERGSSAGEAVPTARVEGLCCFRLAEAAYLCRSSGGFRSSKVKSSRRRLPNSMKLFESAEQVGVGVIRLGGGARHFRMQVRAGIPRGRFDRARQVIGSLSCRSGRAVRDLGPVMIVIVVCVDVAQSGALAVIAACGVVIRCCASREDEVPLRHTSACAALQRANNFARH
jgi:hypothetical protein